MKFVLGRNCQHRLYVVVVLCMLPFWRILKYLLSYSQKSPFAIVDSSYSSRVINALLYSPS